MKLKLIKNLPAEEKFLVEILFEQRLNSISVDNIDYNNIVRLFSSYLLLPALYLRIKKNNLRKFFPPDLYSYLKNIYEINLKRNKIFIEEVNNIKDIFAEKNLKILFIKSSSMYVENLSDKIGERMIGDIDFLVRKKDIDLVVNLLSLSGYNSNLRYKLWQTKHIPRMVGSNKLFAIEPHIELLIYRKRKNLCSKEFWEKSKKNHIYYQALVCILNSQINDYNHLFAKIDYRCINDIYNLEKYSNKVLFNDLKKLNIYVKRFLIITNLLGISNHKINYNFKDKLYIKRLIFKKKIKVFRIIDNLICNFIKFIPILSMQSVEFFVNRDYRKRTILKIKDKLYQLFPI